MKKNKQTIDELRKEYFKSDFKKLERGKYYKRVIAKSNVVILDPDISEIFPITTSVNNALDTLADIMHSVEKELSNSK